MSSLSSSAETKAVMEMESDNYNYADPLHYKISEEIIEEDSEHECQQFEDETNENLEIKSTEQGNPSFLYDVTRKSLDKFDTVSENAIEVMLEEGNMTDEAPKSDFEEQLDELYDGQPQIPEEISTNGKCKNVSIKERRENEDFYADTELEEYYEMEETLTTATPDIHDKENNVGSSNDHINKETVLDKIKKVEKFIEAKSSDAALARRKNSNLMSSKVNNVIPKDDSNNNSNSENSSTEEKSSQIDDTVYQSSEENNFNPYYRRMEPKKKTENIVNPPKYPDILKIGRGHSKSDLVEQNFQNESKPVINTNDKQTKSMESIFEDSSLNDLIYDTVIEVSFRPKTSSESSLFGSREKHLSNGLSKEFLATDKRIKQDRPEIRKRNMSQDRRTIKVELDLLAQKKIVKSILAKLKAQYSCILKEKDGKVPDLIRLFENKITISSSSLRGF